MKVYIIGSLRNPAVPELANQIRKLGFEVFDDWHGVGPEADDHWQKYEQQRGRPYHEALYGHAAENTFNFDKTHIDASDIGVLILPAGKSGHLEIGYMTGRGKRTFILYDEQPERWDVMYRFVDRIFFERSALFAQLTEILKASTTEVLDVFGAPSGRRDAVALSSQEKTKLDIADQTGWVDGRITHQECGCPILKKCQGHNICAT